jgi:peptidylprolyl isomerase
LILGARRAIVHRHATPDIEERMRHRITLITLLLAVAAAACATAGPPLPPPRPVESIDFAPSLNVDLSKMTKTASGLYYRDLETGTGMQVNGKMRVWVHYTGWLTNGVKFDSNASSEPPLEVDVARGRAIKGWDEGLQGVRAGGRRQLVLPATLGYGSSQSGLIPPDAVLVFDITVVRVEY